MLRTDMIRPVSELLGARAAGSGDKTAFIDDHRAVTYRDLDRRTARLAGHLRAAGMARGDRGFLLLHNRVEVAESYLALVRAGMVAVCVNPAGAGPEIDYQLGHSGARVVITDHELAPLVASLLAERAGPALTVVVVGGGTAVPGAVDYEQWATTEPSQPAPDDLGLDDVAFMLYTSGTTGRPKGVLLTQRSLLWVVAACWAPIGGLGPDDVVLSPLPLFHSYALDLCVLGIVAAGATERILRRFSSAEVLDHLRGGGFTLLPGVPTMFQYLLHAAGDEPVTFPGLTRCISAGAIMPAALNEAFEARFGVTLLDGYGITETSTMVIMNWPEGGRVPGSCGLPVPGVGVRLVDPASRRDVGPDEEGEVWISGPNVMVGYHENPEATAAVLTDGWYHTGDLARRDVNGFVTISGRTKELIIRGGENIYPAEVEDAVLTAPGVRDAAVVAMAHPDLGEVPVAFVVPDVPGTVDVEAIRAAVRARLSGFKVPERVFEIDAIPRTGSGKTMRYKLQARLTDSGQAPRGSD